MHSNITIVKLLIKRCKITNLKIECVKLKVVNDFNLLYFIVDNRIYIYIYIYI